MGLTSAVTPHRSLDRLVLERRLKTMTHTELAHRCGVQKSQISLVMRGARNPSLTLLRKMARELEVGIETLDNYLQEQAC